MWPFTKKAQPTLEELARQAGVRIVPMDQATPVMPDVTATSGVQPGPATATSPEAQTAQAIAEAREKEMTERMVKFVKAKGYDVTPSGQKVATHKIAEATEHVVEAVKNKGYTIRGIFRTVTDPIHEKFKELNELGKQSR